MNKIFYHAHCIDGFSAAWAILAYHNSLVDAAVERAYPIVLDGKEGAVTNCDIALVNDVGEKLAEIHGTYGACYYDLSVSRRKWSLRSKGSYDVNAIAKTFGGGGHLNAAGFYTETY